MTAAGVDRLKNQVLVCLLPWSNVLDSTPRRRSHAFARATCLTQI